MSTAIKTTDKTYKTTLKKKGQITLPASIRQALGLEEDDQLAVTIEDGRVVLEPLVSIPKDQAWFLTPEWQEGEKEAQAGIDAGELASFKDVEDAIAWLREG